MIWGRCCQKTHGCQHRHAPVLELLEIGGTFQAETPSFQIRTSQGMKKKLQPPRPADEKTCRGNMIFSTPARLGLPTLNTITLPWEPRQILGAHLMWLATGKSHSYWLSAFQSVSPPKAQSPGGPRGLCGGPRALKNVDAPGPREAPNGREQHLLNRRTQTIKACCQFSKALRSANSAEIEPACYSSPPVAPSHGGA